MAIPALFVFDMIGTTVQSSDAIPETFLSAFAAVGIELTPEQVSDVRGRSKREAIMELLAMNSGESDAVKLQSQVYEAFQESLMDHYQRGNARPVEGASATFDWCHSVGSKVALTTGFDQAVAGIVIENLAWSEKLDALVCNDEVPQGRPAPHLIRRAMQRTGVSNSERVASIGDTVADLEAGNNADVGWNFAVLTGAHDRVRLSRVDGVILLDSIADLTELPW